MGEKSKEGELFPKEHNPRGLESFRKLGLELTEKDKIKKAKERQEKIDKILGRDKK